MSRVMSRARERVALQRLKTALDTAYVPAVVERSGGAVGNGLISVDGQLFQSNVNYGDGVVTVTNVGRPAAAVYAAQGVGGSVVVSGSSSASGGGGGGSGGGSGVSDHGALSGLGDDDHQQYFNAARGDARYALTTGTLVAGSGLTGGGTLASPTITFNVGAANGIDVQADTVGVKLIPTNPGLSLSTDGLALDTHDVIDKHTMASGTTLDLVGRNHLNVFGIVTPSNDVGNTTVERVLKSTSQGALTLGPLTTKGAVNIYNGDLTVYGDTAPYVGRKIFVVDESAGSVGIMMPDAGMPDSQFALDVGGPLRAQYFIGPHAIQLDEALLIAHYDGAEDNYAGEANGHMGQVAVGTRYFLSGKFGKGLAAARPGYNYAGNPGFDAGISSWDYVKNGGTNGGSAWDGDHYKDGGGAMRVTTPDYGYDSIMRSLTGVTAAYIGNGGAVTVSAWVYRQVASYTRIYINRSTDGAQLNETQATLVGQWEYLTATYMVTAADVAANATFSVGLGVGSIAGGNYSVWFDNTQCEAGWWATPFMIGQRVSGTYLAYPAKNNFDPRMGTLMMWVHTSGSDPINWRFFFSAGATNAYFDCGINPQGSLLLRIGGGAVVSVPWAQYEKKWTHIAVTWIGTTGVLYINGKQAGSFTYTPFTLYSHIYVGTLIADISAIANAIIDEFVITGKAMDKDAIRAVYESNAPVFAESSVFSFRATPLGLVWADSEGLWMNDAAGNAVLGAYGGVAATKSWGNKTLESGDILIGRDSGGAHWIHWDDSLGKMIVSGSIQLVAPTEGTLAGLYIGVNRMGYFDGSVFKTYMDNTGKFYLGGTSGSLRWDGSSLYIVGDINATSGQIGSWLIQSDFLSNGGGTIGLTSSASARGGTAIWAGGPYSTAPFRVDYWGNVSGSSVSFTGGSIAGWSLVPYSIYKGNVGMRSREEGAESAGHFTAFYAGGAYNNAPFRVTTLGNVHATTLVTSTTANELKLFAYSDAYTTGYRIGKLYRPSTGSSGLEIGDTDGSGFRISRLDGASNIAYITQMGSANLEIITNSTNRSAIFTSGGALRIGSSLAAGIPAAALTPISTLTLPLNQGVTLGFRYGFLVLIENNTGQSMCCLCVGASIIPIANTDSAFWSYTYGAESRLSIGYTASGIGVFNKYAPAGPNVILNFIFLTFNSY